MAALQARQVMDVLHGAGFTVTLTEDRALKVVPASLLTPALRELISNAKPVLVELLGCDAANDEPPSGSWVAGVAMDGQEIAAFQVRVARICDLGLGTDFAEQQAERMLRRDRDLDDRRLCMECAAFRCGGSWICSNAVQAGLSAGSNYAELAREFTLQFQRCDGFIQADGEPDATLRDSGQDEASCSDISELEEVPSIPG